MKIGLIGAIPEEIHLLESFLSEKRQRIPDFGWNCRSAVLFTKDGSIPYRERIRTILNRDEPEKTWYDPAAGDETTGSEVHFSKD